MAPLDIIQYQNKIIDKKSKDFVDLESLIKNKLSIDVGELYLMFDITCRYRLSVYVLVLLLALLGITLSLVSNAAGDSDELKQQSMEAFKQFNAMSEDQRNSAIKNMVIRI